MEGVQGLYVRPLNEFGSRVVPNSEPSRNPFFSPDGTEIGFFSRGKLWRVPTSGGNPLEIGEVGPTDRGAAWTIDDYIYSGGMSGISRIAVSGGDREAGQMRATGGRGR